MTDINNIMQLYMWTNVIMERCVLIVERLEIVKISILTESIITELSCFSANGIEKVTNQC